MKPLFLIMSGLIATLILTACNGTETQGRFNSSLNSSPGSAPNTDQAQDLLPIKATVSPKSPEGPHALQADDLVFVMDLEGEGWYGDVLIPAGTHIRFSLLSETSDFISAPQYINVEMKEQSSRKVIETALLEFWEPNVMHSFFVTTQDILIQKNTELTLGFTTDTRIFINDNPDEADLVKAEIAFVVDGFQYHLVGPQMEY